MRKCRTSTVRGVWATIAAALTSFASAQEASATRPDSRPVSTESRPVEVDPTVLFRAKAPARRDGFASWSWPTADAFAVLTDWETLRPRPIWTARADVEGTEALRPGGYEVVIADGVSEEGRAVSKIVAATAGPGLGADLSANLTTAWGPALGAPVDVPARHAMRFPRTAPTNDVVCTQMVRTPDARPSAAHATLFGYVAALLDDSPGGVEVAPGRYAEIGEPSPFAAQFAYEAAARGELGRFLRLRLLIVGDLREWLPFSGCSDASFGVEVSSLDEAPIDLAAFLAGLVLQFECGRPRRIELDAEALGRSIARSSVADRLTAWLNATAQDESVDGHNRLRAAQILFFVYAHEPGRAPLEDRSARTRDVGYVRAKLRGLRLSRPAEIWLGQPD